MRFNPQKLTKQRSVLGYTQQTVADLSNVSVRTLQRAERGEPLRRENAADIAAALKMPIQALLQTDEAEESPAGHSDLLMLRRTSSGRELIDLIQSSRLCKLECEVDPTPENLPALREEITTIENWLPNPWDHRATFDSLVERLETIASLNGSLAQLAEHGVSIFIGRRWEQAVMPHYSDEGYYTRTDQRPELVSAARILISSHGGDKRAVDPVVEWPVEVIDTFDDIPF